MHIKERKGAIWVEKVIAIHRQKGREIMGKICSIRQNIGERKGNKLWEDGKEKSGMMVKKRRKMKSEILIIKKGKKEQGYIASINKG